ncbi:MAG: hypothetical protein LBE52_01950 [Providencia sp.]|jgi:hypothetical protein|nr:hypothetical protein [Providencia sp.]
MAQGLSEKDENIVLRITQLERVGSILFFLIPLIILLIIGKTFAFNTLYLWQVYCLFYIGVFRIIAAKLSTKPLQLEIRRGWGYNRFYRLSWCYLSLSIIVMAGAQLFSR